MTDFVVILGLVGAVAAGSFWCGYRAATKRARAAQDGWEAFVKMEREAQGARDAPTVTAHNTEGNP